MAHSGKTITFATDLLPQENNIYNLGNNNQRWKIYGEMQPIAVKTYTAALYNSSSGANYYQTFATVTPADYNAIWIAHYRITITASGHSDYTEICDVSISGRSNTYYSYKVYNSIVTYSIYQHVLLNGSSASYPHELGYRMASSYGATDVQKTVKVELLEQINCTITLLDSLKLYTSAVPTNYSAWRTFNATSNGLQETGDANDTAAYMYSNGFKGQVGSNKIYPYTLFARTGNGKYESFVLSNTTAASKSVNTHGFLPDGKIYYNSGSSTYSEGTLNFNAYQQYHVVDYRYSFNINNSTLPDYCETYLVWMYNTTDGLLYLDTTQWLATALPSNVDGKIYQRIGSKYYTGTSNYYQGSLLLDNPYYEYKNGAIHEWNGNAVHADTAPLSGISGANNLKAIEALTETSGLLKKTAANTWTLDTSTYSTTSHDHDDIYYKLDGSNTGTKICISTQSAAYTNQIQFMNSTTKKGSIGFDNTGIGGIYAASKVILRPQLDASTKGVEVTTSAMYPTANITLGTSTAANKWSTVYATTFDGTTTSLTHAINQSDGLKIKYSTTIDYFIGVGTGNENHGLYDNKASGGAKWILSANSNNIWTFVGNVTGNVTGNLTGNADTATKLAASKTIWGQNFDGSANVTGNMTNVGPSLKLPADAGTDFYFLKSDSKAAAGYFGKLALNTTYANADLTNYVLDVLGAVRIKLPNSSTTSSRKFIVTRGNDNQNLSISVSGIQAYNNTTVSNLCLQYYGGTLQVGTSDTAMATRDMYGQFTFHSTSGFTYGGMETGTTNIDRPIWFMAASNTSTLVTGRPVYSSNFKYNPSTNTLSTGAITTTGNITSSGNITATSTITAENYNNGIKVARVQAWNKTGPYNAGWKRVCSLTGYNSYGIGTVYIGGGWSNSEPTLAAFEIAFSQANSSFTRIKQTICAKKEVPDQIRLVYSGTGGKWYFDIHIPERTASNKVGVRYVTFVGKLTVSEINDTDDFLDSEPTTATITRELISSNDQPTITVDLTSTTIGSFTGANMTTGVSGTLPIASGGTGVTSFTKDCVIVSDGATTPKLESRGLKVTGATNAAVTVTVNNTNSGLTISPNGSGTMTLSSTTGATTISTTNGALTVKSTGTGTVALQATSSGNVTVSSTTGTMTISSTNGNMTIGPTGTGTNTIKTNSGALTISTTSGNMSLSSGGTVDISSGSSKALSITSGSTMSLDSGTSMSISSGGGKTTLINSGSTMYLQRTSGASIVFCGGGTAIANYHGGFNPSGNFWLETGANTAGTQNTHKLYVKGDSAFEGKIAFATAASDVITNKAYMQWNATDLSIDFIFA